jgi:hypothetical protein
MQRQSTLIYGLLVTILILMDPGVRPADRPAMAGIPTEQRLEVIIRDYAFEIVHRTQPEVGGDTVIIVRNQDIVRHGFTSPTLAELYLRAEGEGLSSYGKGIEGFYVEPGKTLVIRLVLERSGRLSFHCDLHPEMKGELFLLDIPAA